MTFLWPEMLWLLLVVPAARGRLFLSIAPQAAERAQICELEHGEGGDGRGPEISPPHPAAAFFAGTDRNARRRRPSRRRGHLAVAAPNHHPRHGRLRQHARRRRAAQSNYRVPGRGQSLRRRATLQRTHRRGVLRRNGGGRAGRPRKIAKTSSAPSIASNCSAAPPSAAASSFLSRRFSPMLAST